MFTRKCPICGCCISYINIKNRNRAEKCNKKCKSCVYVSAKIKVLLKYKKLNNESFSEEEISCALKMINKPNKALMYLNEKIEEKRKKRITERESNRKIRREEVLFKHCPTCGGKMFYKQRSDFNRANLRGVLCKSCAKKGEKNSFFGKHHTEKTKIKMKESKSVSEKCQKYFEYLKSEEVRKQRSIEWSGENNPRYGNGSLKDIWIKKYGKKEGERRNKEWIEKLSSINSGKNNNMYGKPSPQGSGNGWSGWYNGWFFRSLRELSYMINIIEKNKLEWESGEKKKYKVEYIDFQGQKRNYFPDFILEGKKMVECKPKRLQKSKAIKLKTNAAIEFCENNNLTFEIIDPPILSEEEILKLYESKKIVFTDRYEEKFKERYLNKKP